MVVVFDNAVDPIHRNNCPAIMVLDDNRVFILVDMQIDNLLVIRVYLFSVARCRFIYNDIAHTG